LLGTVLGGTRSDRVDIDLIADLSLRGDQLQQFETLQVTSTGALNFTGGAATFDHLVTNSRASSALDFAPAINDIGLTPSGVIGAPAA